jgi:hypothetical protein
VGPSTFFLWERYPVVLDTNVLLSDCAHVVRSGKISFLLASAQLPIAHLFATERVRAEVERYLPSHAERSGLDSDEVIRVWRERYVPVIRFVDVEGEARDPRVAALAARDVTDKPTGLLAELLAPCLVFSRDKDLLDPGIARREWVTLSSAGQDVAQLQAIYTGGAFGTMLLGVTGWELGRGVTAAAKAAPLTTLLVGGVAGFLLWRHWNSERGSRQRVEARSLLGDAARGIGAVWSRAAEAEQLLEAAAFVPDSEPTLGTCVARLVAGAPIPLRAAEVGERLGISTQKAASVLRAPIFVRSADARYLLGRSYAADSRLLEPSTS